MAQIEVNPLQDGLSFGARIRGVDWDVLADAAMRKKINDVFEDRGMIVFEEVEPTDKMQLELSRVFGPLKDHPVKATPRVDEDELHGAIKNQISPEYSDIVEIDGKQYTNWLPWHFDHCYNNELNRAGVLRAMEDPPKGCQTVFMDGVELYKAFPPALLSRIEQRSILYSMAMHFSYIRFGRPKSFRHVQEDSIILEIMEQAKVTPRAIHPAVWTRASGEKVLHISPWMALGIEGHEDAAGDELLEAVCEEVNRVADAGAYYHTWQPTQMVIWDNWRFLHRVTGCTPPQPRCMSRTTIKGDYGLGHFEANDTGWYQVLQRTV